MTRVAIMVVVDTDDPTLNPETIDVSTVEATRAVRKAVVAALPNMLRVVSVMSEDHARLMMYAHDRAAAMSGLSPARRPPKAYVAPADAGETR